MRTWRPFLGIAVGLLLFAEGATEVQAQGPAGALTIAKTCAPGVSGQALFGSAFQLPGTPPPPPVVIPIDITIPCGGSFTLPNPVTTATGPVTLVDGTRIFIHEVNAPTGGVPAADAVVTLSATPQTVTIVNQAGTAAGTITIAKQCDSGLSGAAGFTLTVQLPGQPTPAPVPNFPVVVPCGGTFALPPVLPVGNPPAPTPITVGTIIVITEQAAPAGAAAAAPQTVTVGATPQTVTIVNHAQPQPAGALTIAKVCLNGISGSATFGLSVLLPAGQLQPVLNDVVVACGGSTAVPATVALASGPHALVVGDAVSIFEKQAPPHAVGAPGQTFVLSPAPQTATFVNNAAAPQPGGPVHVRLVCGNGVTGPAVFSLTIQNPGTPPPPPVTLPDTRTVECGLNLTGDWTVETWFKDDTVTVTELVAPTGSTVAPPQHHLVVDGSPINFTFTNNAQTAGPLTINSVCDRWMFGDFAYDLAVFEPGLPAIRLHDFVSGQHCNSTVTLTSPLTTPSGPLDLVAGTQVTVRQAVVPYASFRADPRTATLTIAGQSITITNHAANPRPPELVARPATDTEWVQRAYEDLLHRAPIGSELNAGLAALLAPHAGAVTPLLNSDEYRALLVTNDYKSLLGRTPAPAEVTPWVSLLRAGSTDEQVLSGILGSTEYFQDAGGTDAGFVAAIYDDLLHRAATPADLATWTALIHNGASRSSVAVALEASPEYRQQLVTSWYAAYLQRPPAAGELGPLVALLGSTTDETGQAIFLGSNTYFQERALGSADRFITTVYQDLLRRTPDPAGQTTFINLLAAPRSPLAGAIATGDEHSAQTAAEAYTYLLGRAPQPAELAFWTTALQQGATELDLKSAVAATNEYFSTRDGGSVSRYVSSLYIDFLHRDCHPSECASISHLAQFSRVAAARLVINSPESRTALVRTEYLRLLHRDPAPPETATWTQFLGQGGSLAHVDRVLVSTQEYYQLAPALTAGENFLGLVALQYPLIGDAPPVPAGGASVAWGDGSTSPGTFTPNGLHFEITGSHTYDREGAYTVTITTGNPDLTGSFHLAVKDPPIRLQATTPDAVEGAPAVLSASILDPSRRPGDLFVRITGDRTTSIGTVSGATVSGAHTFAEEGSVPMAFTVIDLTGGSRPMTLPFTVLVTDAPLAAQGRDLRLNRRHRVSGVVAAFTDTNPHSRASEFRAAIAWGDGSVSTGRVVLVRGGRYVVMGRHRYAGPPPDGVYEIQTTITDAGGSQAVALSTARPRSVGPMP